MNDEVLGYRKTGKDTYEPITQSKGYIFTAAVLTCGKCKGMISGMGGPGNSNTICVPCYTELKREQPLV